jgi:hypothetical protein
MHYLNACETEKLKDFRVIQIVIGGICTLNEGDCVIIWGLYSDKRMTTLGYLQSAGKFFCNHID